MALCLWMVHLELFVLVHFYCSGNRVIDTEIMLVVAISKWIVITLYCLKSQVLCGSRKHFCSPYGVLKSEVSFSFISGIEARGFIFGPPIALAIGAKFVPLRKPRKLPGNFYPIRYFVYISVCEHICPIMCSMFILQLVNIAKVVMVCSKSYLQTVIASDIRMPHTDFLIKYKTVLLD